MTILAYFFAFISWVIPFQEGPRFNAGKLSLQDFISQNIIYPGYAKANCIQGTVIVNFNVDKNGQVNNIFVSNGLGVDLDDEAIRVIQLTNGKWDTKNMRYKSWNMVLPVKFSLEEPSCLQKTKTEINNAVAYYQIQEQLQNTVFEYYKKKEKGEHNLKDEPHILKLKQDLGFDDDFISQKLEEAKKMIRQGDKENACKTLTIIKDIGSSAADKLIEENCK